MLIPIASGNNSCITAQAPAQVPKGTHGMGLGSAHWDPGSRHAWTQECALWLKEQGFGTGIPRN
jgi:hypothetical protein